MEMDAHNRYKDLRRQAEMYHLIRRMKPQRRARRKAMWRNFMALMRSFIAGRRRLKPQT
jgi:hypothetical protein